MVLCMTQLIGTLNASSMRAYLCWCVGVLVASPATVQPWMMRVVGGRTNERQTTKEEALARRRRPTYTVRSVLL